MIPIRNNRKQCAPRGFLAARAPTPFGYDQNLPSAKGQARPEGYRPCRKKATTTVVVRFLNCDSGNFFASLKFPSQRMTCELQASCRRRITRTLASMKAVTASGFFPQCRWLLETSQESRVLLESFLTHAPKHAEATDPQAPSVANATFMKLL